MFIQRLKSYSYSSSTQFGVPAHRLRRRSARGGYASDLAMTLTLTLGTLSLGVPSVEDLLQSPPEHLVACRINERI